MINKRFGSMLLLAVVSVVMVMASATAKAQSYSAAIVTENNNCLMPDGNNNIYVYKCTDGAAGRYYISDGRIKTAQGLCFDHSIAKGVSPSRGDASVKLVACQSGKSQQWYFIADGRGKGLVQNAGNPEVCMNIASGQDNRGGRIVVWPCGYNNPAANERFYIGGPMSTGIFNALPANISGTLRSGGSATYSNGTRLVATGGGNLVASGAGNLVATGGGNVIAAGAGNVISVNSANIAAGLVGNSGGTLSSMGAATLRQ